MNSARNVLSGRHLVSDSQPPFSSIRWRLIFSYVILTLLTAGAIGILSVLLIRSFIAKEEHEYLNANAEAIARQAAHFMQPVMIYPPLQQLAQTTSFLGDVHVRILDRDNQLIADSGRSGGSDELAWVVYRTEMGEATPSHPPTLFLQFDPNQEMPHLSSAIRWHSAAPPTIMSSYVLRQTPSPQDEDIMIDAVTVEEIVDTFPGKPAIYNAGSRSSVLENDVTHSPYTLEHPEYQGTDYDVVVVQKSPSVWGDRLTFEQSTITTTQTFTTTPLRAQAIQMIASTNQSNFTATPGKLQKVLRTESGEEVASPGEEMGGEVVTAPIYAGETLLGYVELRRASNFSNESLGAIRRGLLIAALGASLLATIVGLIISRGLTAPLQQLTLATEQMSAGNLSARAPIHRHDELGALAAQFNRMAARLQQNFAEVAAERDTLRRFIADASHELRTPITALHTFIELLQGPAVDNVDARQEFLLESQEQVTRLEWITHNLLDLSRLETGLASLDLADEDLGALLTHATMPFKARAQERQLSLHVEIPSAPVMVQCDANRIKLAISNLLDNALKFTPSPGQIGAGITVAGEWVTLWVADTGTGIHPEDMPYIFERFHRSPRSKQPGSGLGLAIVKSVIQAHTGEVSVESKPGQGSRFTLRLPTNDNRTMEKDG